MCRRSAAVSARVLIFDDATSPWYYRACPACLAATQRGARSQRARDVGQVGPRRSAQCTPCMRLPTPPAAPLLWHVIRAPAGLTGLSDSRGNSYDGAVKYTRPRLCKEHKEYTCHTRLTPW